MQIYLNPFYLSVEHSSHSYRICKAFQPFFHLLLQSLQMSLLTRWPEFPLYNAICHTQQMFAQGSPPVFFLCIRIHIIQHKNPVDGAVRRDFPFRRFRGQVNGGQRYGDQGQQAHARLIGQPQE